MSKLYVVGIGPGNLLDMTPRARQAIEEAAAAARKAAEASAREASLREKIVARVRTLKNVSDDFETAMNEMGEVERAVRAEIDAAFGSPVSEAAFGGVNCLSFAGGQPIVLNFLEAIVPEIQKEFEA